jgi:hypothetical protein
MREEIIGGIRNAMERGASMDDAIQSFINAGYNLNDVEEVKNYLLESGATTMIYPIKVAEEQPEKKEDNKTVSPITGQPEEEIRKLVQTTSTIKNGGPKKKVLIIFIISLLLMILGAIILIILFREEIISFVTKLFP